MAYIVMTYIVMAYLVMTYIVMTYIVMTCIVMAALDAGIKVGEYVRLVGTSSIRMRDDWEGLCLRP